MDVISENKPITITGSRGFIGTAIRKFLTIDSFEEIDLEIGKHHRNIKNQSGMLIHLSDLTGENESFQFPVKYIENNLRDLAHILQSNKFDKVIFPSTTSIYGKFGNEAPSTVYAVTKLAAEKLIRIYCRECWILRLANPYGPNDRRSAFYKLAKCKKENGKFTIYDWLMARDFFHVDHVGKIVDQILKDRVKPGTYDVGSGRTFIVPDLLKLLCEKHSISYEYIDPPIGISRNNYISDGPNLIKDKERNIEEEWAKCYL